jgi:hypothetical protein
LTRFHPTRATSCARTGKPSTCTGKRGWEPPGRRIPRSSRARAER